MKFMGLQHATRMHVCIFYLPERGPIEGWDDLSWNGFWGHSRHSLDPSCKGTLPCKMGVMIHLETIYAWTIMTQDI